MVLTPGPDLAGNPGEDNDSDNNSDVENASQNDEIEYWTFDRNRQKKPKILSKSSSTYYKQVKKERLLNQVQVEQAKKRLQRRLSKPQTGHVEIELRNLEYLGLDKPTPKLKKSGVVQKEISSKEQEDLKKLSEYVKEINEVKGNFLQGNMKG
jgi:hypothetical protein